MNNPATGLASESEALESLSLFHLMDPAVRANPYPLYRRLRTEDPVHWDPYLHAWIVTRYQDVVTVLTRFSADRTPTPEYFEALGVPEVSPIARVMVKQMLFKDAPAHTRLRKLAGPAFMPARVRLLRQHIEEIADRLIDDMEARSHGTTGPDGRLCGATSGHRDGRDARRSGRRSCQAEGVVGHVCRDAQETFSGFNPDRLSGVLQAVEGASRNTFRTPSIERTAEYPRDGLIQSLMSAQEDGDRLTDEEIVANCIVTMVGGLETTTTNLIGNGTLALLRKSRQAGGAARRP